MIKDTYKTISKISQGEYREKGSKFFCYLYPIKEKEDVVKTIELLKKSHPKARHFCHAWRLGINFEPQVSNDDGEPSGSAGRPILGQLQSAELSDVLAVVVRYFGGTKLGVPGLINAYKTATKDAIHSNVIIDKILSSQYKLVTTYDHMGKVLEIVKKINLKLLKKDFTTKVEIDFEIPLSEETKTLHQLKAYLLGINPKELTEDLLPDYVDIIKIE